MNKLLAFILFLTCISLVVSQCDDGELPLGNLCLSQNQLDAIVDQLDNLDDSPSNNSSVSASSEIKLQDGEQLIVITFQYNPPYRQESQFIIQEVDVEGNTIPDGVSGQAGATFFDPNGQNLQTTLNLNNLEDMGCQILENEDQIMWQCEEISLNIGVAGMNQACFKFRIEVEVDQQVTGLLTVNVVKNEVQGVCCENELNIDTELNFCTDITCTAFLPSPLTVIRKDSIFIEHRISSPGFSNFYLQGLSVRIGDFLPVIIQQINDQKGRVIYEVQSNIAKPDLLVQAISQLSKTAPSRRLLGEEVSDIDIRDDYKVKGIEYINVLEISEGKKLKEQQQLLQQQQQIEQEESVATKQKVLIGVLSVLGLQIVAMVSYCLLKKRKALKTKTDQKSTVSVPDVEILSTEGDDQKTATQTY